MNISSLILWQNLNCFVSHLCPSNWLLKDKMGFALPLLGDGEALQPDCEGGF